MMRADDLKIRRLSTHEVREAYRKYLTNDFPRNERRPLGNIMRMRRRGQYVCCGAFCENRLAGYAFFIILDLDGKRCCLLDYFAVLPALRGRQIGSRFLARLENAIRPADLILVEVEDPDKEEDPAKKAVQERRLSFYLKNGLRDTAVRVETFGVPYRILEFPLPGGKTETAAARTAEREEIRPAYEAFYRTRLPARVFDRYVHFA